ncbi:Coatomer subunit gamma-1, partial [Saguinus oedipus]
TSVASPLRAAPPSIELLLHPTGSTMLKKFDKKDEESSGGSNPLQHLEKRAILQEAHALNETPINPQKCAHILIKILYLINHGEHLGTTEAAEAFFAMTKLFQSNDLTL